MSRALASRGPEPAPDKVAKAIDKERAKLAKGGTPAAGVAAANSTANIPHDRRAARSLLREARAALASGEIDKAESLAREVRSWGLRYGLLDDTPEKVAALAGEARRLEAVRNAELMVRSYVGTEAAKPGDSRGEPTVPVAPEVVPVSPR